MENPLKKEIKMCDELLAEVLILEQNLFKTYKIERSIFLERPEKKETLIDTIFVWILKKRGYKITTLYKPLPTNK
jgi:hypothetical protein